MVNILIIGATGYVGQALCQSLVRSGDHIVYGLARTSEKAQQLEASEVIPIRGSISDNAELVKAIEDYHINVVVDVAGADKASYDLLDVLKTVGAARISSSGINTKLPKLGFIYCSGTWVHGSSNEPVNDLTPVDTATSPTPPARLTSWRPELERAVLASSDVLDTMIIRPALIFGRSSAIWSLYFEPLLQAASNGDSVVELIADIESRPGLVHVDDVASGFHVAIEKLPLLAGTGVYPFFDLVTSQESMKDILEAAASKLGFVGKVKLVGSAGDPFPEAMNTTFNGSSGRAKTLLGWSPKRIGFVNGMGVFANAWKASK